MQKRFSKLIFMIVVAGIITFSNMFAQPFAGADFVSRYVWRGLEINKSFNVQPSFGYGTGALDIGLWGSYAISDVENTLQSEIDLYASYNFSIPKGKIVIFFTDYYFPDGNARLSDFDDGKGAHTIELGVGYAGPSSLPITFSVYMNVYNDDGYNMYFEVGYPVVLPDNYSMDLFIGATPGSEDNAAYYGTDKFGLLNVGFKVSKDIVITKSFSVPAFISYVMNPTSDKAHLVAGFSIGI